LILVFVGVVEVECFEFIGEGFGGVLLVLFFQGRLIDQLRPIECPEGMGMEGADLLVVDRKVLTHDLPGGGLGEARNQD